MSLPEDRPRLAEGEMPAVGDRARLARSLNSTPLGHLRAPRTVDAQYEIELETAHRAHIHQSGRMEPQRVNRAEWGLARLAGQCIKLLMS